jgi:hypothetical protein
MFLRLLFLSILCICLLKIAGYMSVFKVEQWLIHQKIEAVIEQFVDNEQLELISISTENQQKLKWERIDKEFWYEGKLYDIVRAETKDSVTHYYCIDDTEETQLVYQFIEEIKKQTDNTDNERTAFIDFFKKILKIYIPSPFNPQNTFVLSQKSHKSKVLTPYINHYASQFYNRIDPPPKQVI